MLVDLSGNAAYEVDVPRNPDSDTFGRRLAQARAGRGKTARALADALGVAATTLSQWENNHRRPDVDQLAALCRELHVSADVLLGRLPFQLGPLPDE